MLNKVIVITGSSAGIGAAVAAHLAKEGASLGLIARRADVLGEVAQACGPNALPVVADVTNRAAVQMAVKTVIDKFGHIDVWINNAGQGITRQPTQLTDEDIDDMVRVNVKSVLYGMQEVLPHFMAQGNGHIINVSSMLGRVPFAVQRSAYSAAKHFMNSLTANFRTEVQATHPGIQFSLVSPGVVRTQFGLSARNGGMDSRQIPDSQSAGEVAAVIAGVIRSRLPDVYTRPGSAARVAGYYATVGVDAV